MRIFLQALPDHAAPPAKERQKFSQRPDVRPIVHRFTGKQFGRGIFPRSGGKFQDAVSVVVGKSEVDNLDILPVVGNQNVGWLQILVNHLFGVDVTHRVKQLVQETALSPRRQRIGSEILIQRHPVYPLHLYTPPEFNMLREGIYLTDIGAREVVSDIKLLAQQRYECRIIAVLGRQAFEYAPLSLPIHQIQLVDSIGGTFKRLHRLRGVQHRIVRGKER